MDYIYERDSAYHSIGLVSVIVSREIVKALALPLIGVLRSDLFQSAAVVRITAIIPFIVLSYNILSGYFKVSREQPSYAVRIYGDRRIVGSDSSVLVGS